MTKTELQNLKRELASVNAQLFPSNAHIAMESALTCIEQLEAKIATLEASVAANQKDAEVTLPVPDDSQDWAKLDGSVAWHLIDRHAEGWGQVGDMMEAWGKARFGSPDTSTQEVG